MENTAFISETFFSSAQGSEIFCENYLTDSTRARNHALPTVFGTISL